MPTNTVLHHYSLPTTTTLYLTSLSTTTFQDEAVSAKATFLAKSGREKRNLERQKARLLTKEETERLQELENKRLVSVHSMCLHLCVLHYLYNVLYYAYKYIYYTIHYYY